jgi:hypothetical protein
VQFSNSAIQQEKKRKGKKAGKRQFSNSAIQQFSNVLQECHCMFMADECGVYFLNVFSIDVRVDR